MTASSEAPRMPPDRRAALGALLLVALGLAGLPVAAAADATPAAESAPAAADPVAARFPAPAVHYALPSLAAGREDFTHNDELSALLARLARSPGVPAAGAGTAPVAAVATIHKLLAGRSQQGEPIEALHFSRGPGRPLVFLMGQQHGDEPAGAEALLVIAQQLAEGDLVPLLDRIDVLLLPRVNPDGARAGQRVASNGIDINRDHLLLRTPEAQAVAALMRSHRPLVVVDAHEHTVAGRYREKFDAVQRNDLLLQYAMTPNLPPALGRASEDWFRLPIVAALDREGLRSEWYYTNSMAPQALRLTMGGVQPDTGRNVNGLRHAVSLLLESRGVGIGRQHLLRRIHSQVVALRSVLASAAAHGTALQALQRSADAEVAASACQGRVLVAAGTTPTQRELLMLDPRTGADKPLRVDWDSALQLRPQLERARPCGYWLAAGELLAVQRLKALGLRVHTFDSAQTLQAEAWLEQARGETARPDVRGQAADGEQTIVRVVTELAPRTLQAEAGSHYVPLDQPLAHLAVAALEPDTQSSFFANRLIGTLAAAARVMQRPAPW